jgi:hypothetical protein
MRVFLQRVFVVGRLLFFGEAVKLSLQELYGGLVRVW